MSRSATENYRESHRMPGKGADYDRNFEHRHRAFLWSEEKRLLEELLGRNLKKDSVSYLDFACGTGRILGHLLPRCSSAVGVDVSEAMMAVARKKIGAVDLVRADLTAASPFGGSKFDLITAFRFFPNAEDSLRADAIRSLADLLDRDGILIFNNHKNRYSAVGMAMRLYCRLRGTGFRTMTLRQMENLALGAQLEVIDVAWTGVVPGYEWLMFLPRRAYAVLEKLLGGLSWTRHIALDQIVVCRRRR